jgi:hypothetical protein
MIFTIPASTLRRLPNSVKLLCAAGIGNDNLPVQVLEARRANTGITARRKYVRYRTLCLHLLREIDSA